MLAISSSLFGKAYQKVRPGHELFASANAERLSRTVPVLLHGDGGRTQKKQPIEIVSLEAALGLSSYQRKRSSCVCCPPAKRARSEFMGKLEVQQLNHKLHSYLSRFLVFARPSKQYREVSRPAQRLSERGGGKPKLSV